MMKTVQICRWLLLLTILFVLAFNVLFQLILGENTSPISETMQRRHMTALNASLVKLNEELRTLLHQNNSQDVNLSRSKGQPFAQQSINNAGLSNLRTVDRRANEVVHRVTQKGIVPRSVLIFTMDSITSYEDNSKFGGAAGMF